MDKTALYKEGARLPEQLARLIFLEGMVAGRRVLEVGSRSDAVARFLIEQGAARVVCAVDDRHLCERLRDANDNDQIDFRVIRPAGGSRPPGIAQAPVLPGDDGAFDLVIDFTLPEALASGVTERLTDIKRLLSLDGFAITALASEPQNPRGLSLLLDEGMQQPRRLAYRPLVDALRGTFELAQVYFQSMMLGYLFGSFDIEGGDDGIAPQTALMGDDAEPAGSYLFTFGNAIPVIEDVCLVQLPFDTLLDAVLARRPLALGARAAQGNDHAAEIMALQAELRALAETNAQLRASASRPPMPAEDVGVVVEGIARRLDEAVARALASEQQVAMREVELVRVLAVRDELRLERDSLAEQLVALDGQAGALSSRSKSLEEELLLTAMRVEELEDGARGDDARRSALQLELIELQTAREHERLRHNAERELLEAAIAESSASVADLQAALDEIGVPLAPTTPTVTTRGGSDDDTVAYEDARNDGTATVAARVRASLQERFAIVEDRALRAETLATTLTEQLGAAERELEDLRLAVDERAAAVEAAHAAQAAMATEGAAALHAALQTALDDAREALGRRTDEATKLAAAVVGLVDEREQQRAARSAQQAKLHALNEALRQARARADEHEERLATLTARSESTSARDRAELTELRLALDEARAAVAASNAAAESAREERARLTTEQQHEQHEAQQKIEQRRAHDLRQLEDARRQLEEARTGVFEITAQRDVVQQALVARERELAVVVDEVAAARARIEQLQGEHTAHGQKHADVEKAAEALSLEVRRLNGVVDDNGARLLALTQERDALKEQLTRAEAGRSSAEDEALKLMALVEEAESKGVADRDQWRAEQSEAHRAAINLVEEQLQAATARLTETEAALTRALDAARLAADESAEQRRALGEERESHERTRDELATTTSTMLNIESEAARARADAEAAVAAAIANSDAIRTAREAEFEQTVARLRSEGDTAAQAAVDAVRAELTTSFASEKAALDTELQQLRASHDELVGVRTVIEATLAEATAALVERTAELEVLSARHAELGLEHGRRDDEAKALAATIEALHVEHAAAKAELSSSLTQSQSSLSLSAEATDALHAQLATTKAALATAEAELVRQREATAAAEAEWLKAAEEATAATTALSTVQAAHDAVVAERYALIIEREALTAKASELANRVEVLQKRFDETMAQLEEVDEEAQLAAERAWQKSNEQDKAIADLRAALDDASAAHAKVIDQIRTEHGDALAAAELAHAELTQTLETRSARETELELQATRARGDVDAAIADIARLREELAAAQTAQATTQATLQTALDEAAAIAATMNNRLREADEAHAEAVNALEARLAAELQRAIAANDEHDAALAALDDAAANERAQLVAGHDAALALLRGELADTVAAAAQLTRDLEAARADGNERLAAQQTRHEQHLASLEEQRAADAARHADDLRAALARADEASAAKDAQATAAATATTRISELERALDDAINQYAAEAEQKEAHETELAALRTRLDEQTKQQQRLDKERDDERAVAQQRHEAQLTELRREQDALIARHVEALAAVHGERDGAIGEHAALRGAHDALVETHRTLQQRADDDAHAAEQRLAELQELQERFDAAAREHADVDAARLAVVAALSAVESEQQALRARVADVDAQAEALVASERRVVELTMAVDAARSEHEAAVADLRQQLESLRADVDDERRELQEQVAKVSADADEERLRAEALEARVREADARVAELSARAADVDLLREEAERQSARHAAALDDAVAVAVNNAVVTAAAAHAEAIEAAVSEAVAEAVAREQQRALGIADDVATQLANLQKQLEVERAQHAVVVDTLDEARTAADRERARTEVLSATLEEARTAADRERARTEVLSATLEEARTAADRERARVAVLEATLDEARASADAERAQHQQHHQALLVGLEETRAAVKIAERRARDEARAAQMEVSSLRAELDEVHASSSQLPTPVVDDQLVLRLREEIAELNAYNESRVTEIAGLRDALLTAREDHRELEELVNAHEARAEALSMTLAQQEQTLATLQQAHHDLNIDSEVASAQRDAALAEIDAAEAQATEAMAARRVLEDELAAMRLELERALAHAAPTTSTNNTAELSMLREKLEAADKHLRVRDEKIAEQAERINRLTERIVRTEH